MPPHPAGIPLTLVNKRSNFHGKPCSCVETRPSGRCGPRPRRRGTQPDISSVSLGGQSVASLWPGPWGARNPQATPGHFGWPAIIGRKMNAAIAADTRCALQNRGSRKAARPELGLDTVGVAQW